MNFPPRILRPSVAAEYCGMGRTLFEREIRPHLRPIRIGEIGVGFDRIAVDAALDDYISRNAMDRQETTQCDPKSKGSVGARKPAKGKLTSASTDDAFKRDFAQIASQKQKRSSTAR